MKSAAYFLLLAINLLPAGTLIVYSDITLESDQILLIFGSSLLSLICLGSVLARFPRTAIFIISILSIFAWIETVFIRKYGWSIDANTLSLIAETNPGEAADIGNSIPLKWFAPIGILIALGITAWRGSGSLTPELPLRRIAIYSLSGWLATIAIAGFLGQEPPWATDSTVFPLQKAGQEQALRAAFPAGLPWVAYDFVQERAALSRAIEQTKRFRFAMAPKGESPRRRIYVLVIGESSRADHWSINGYARETTPRLKKEDGLISFTRLYTPWTFTRLAVPLLITRKPPSVASAVFNEASIVTAFKQAGFFTGWISLQASVGYHESPISLSAHQADEVRFLNPVDYRYRGQHDDAAIPVMREMISNTQRDSFIVVHLLGSHFRYADRYPAKFSVFQPDANGREQLFNPNDKTLLVNGYDNSILFTDFVIDSLITTLRDQANAETWLLYSSDHGEALFDDCRMQSGHGEYSTATQHVSALFWYSRNYQDSHPAQVEFMKKHKDSFASTAMFFETMSDLADLNIVGNRHDNSLAAEPLRNPFEVRNAEQAFTCPSH
ncbi:phosphoethanolamine transferase [Dyella sp.]|uniref:phosphoethanolamine transferase n=1 Tax=Dyella sp. TaxID=1869338 RepID=UPI002ED6AA17